MTLTIGVDIGGTKVAGGVVDPGGRILEKVRLPTPATDSAQTLAAIVEVIRQLSARHEVEAVGLGVAGFVDEARSSVVFAPNLTAWRNEPLRERVQERVALPVVVENDANAMAWAEACFGAGQGEDYLVCLTLGTGIGGGIVLEGELYRGRWGIGAEVGHFRVVPDGRLCGCGNRGCLEQYASGKALVAEARDLARRSPGSAARLLELGDGAPDGITGPEVTQAAREGDTAALACFAITAGWLGQGLADLAAVLDPGRFVIGGGVCEAGEILLRPVREAYSRALTGRSHRRLADIRTAELGPEAGLVGAAALARRR